MAMNFDIPDISETAGKAVTGGKKRKTRKIGALRLGDSLRMIANHFTCTEERIVPQLSENEQKQRSVRITIKGLLYGLAVMIVLAVAYVAYNLYSLLN